MISDNELLILTLDYVPLLGGTAFEIYLLHRSSSDENGISGLTYGNLIDHIGRAQSTISSANQSLIEIGLIEQVDKEKVDGPEFFSPYKKALVRVLPILPLSNERREKLFREKGKNNDSEIRQEALTLGRLPEACKILVNMNQLKVLHRKLGKQGFTVAGIIEHLPQLDKGEVKLWLTNKDFRSQVIASMRLVTQEADKVEVLREIKEVKEKKIKFRAKKKAKAKTKALTFDELYATLMQWPRDKNGDDIPRSKWQPFQLFRHFCFLYESKYNSKFRFEPKANAFSLKELKDMKSLLLAFNNNSIEVIDYLDWIFKVKSKDLDNLDGTAILRHQRMLNEYQRRKQESHTYRKMDSIDIEYMEWVKKNTPDLLNDYDFERMKDLYWMKEDYNEGEGGEVLIIAIEEGIKRGLVPKEGNIKLR